MKRFLLFTMLPAALLAAVGGCSFLPAGDPPAGPIVDNPGRENGRIQQFSMRNALEFFISELINASSIYCYGENIRIEAADASAQYAAYIIDNVGKFSGVRRISGNTAKCARVRSELKGKLWAMVLYDKEGKAVWSETVEITGK